MTQLDALINAVLSESDTAEDLIQMRLAGVNAILNKGENGAIPTPRIAHAVRSDLGIIKHLLDRLREQLNALHAAQDSERESAPAIEKKSATVHTSKAKETI